MSPEELRRADACWTAGEPVAMVDQLRGWLFLTRHTLMVLRMGEPARAARALGAESVMLCIGRRKRLRKADALIGRARRLADRCGKPRAIADCRVFAGYQAFYRGQWKSAARMLFDAEAMLGRLRHGTVWSLAVLQIYSGRPRSGTMGLDVGTVPQPAEVNIESLGVAATCAARIRRTVRGGMPVSAPGVAWSWQ